MESSIWVYLLGLLAQALFSARVLVQWFKSEKTGKVENPTLFWVLSLAASLIFFAYGSLRKDFPLMLGQILGFYVYIWNLGAKDVWRRFGGWRFPLVTLISLVPAAAFCGLSLSWESISQTLFSNEGIPLWLMVFGSAGQVIFSTRFLYQFIFSSRHGESVLPLGFWLISLIGSVLILTYGIIRLDPVVILAQCFGLASYIRNLVIWKRSSRS